MGSEATRGGPAMTLLRDFRRVTKLDPCPVCAKPDWCLVSADGSTAICARVESSNRAGEAGWLHRLREGDRPSRRRSARCIRLGEPSGGLRSESLQALAEQYCANLPRGGLNGLATNLGLSPDSLLRLRIGWTGRAWSFPMTDAQGCVRGIRLRYPDGSKCAVKGGREGLFIPDGLQFEALLLIAEGPTDCAVLLDLGFNAIGRPNCSGGRRLIVDFVTRHRVRDVAIVADTDEVGRRGAEALAGTLTTQVQRVRIIAPPDGVKDTRAWKIGGATRTDVQDVINAAKPSCVVVKGVIWHGR